MPPVEPREERGQVLLVRRREEHLGRAAHAEPRQGRQGAFASSEPRSPGISGADRA